LIFILKKWSNQPDRRPHRQEKDHCRILPQDMADNWPQRQIEGLGNISSFQVAPVKIQVRSAGQATGQGPGQSCASPGKGH
jgi:hypothetical protein